MNEFLLKKYLVATISWVTMQELICVLMKEPVRVTNWQMIMDWKILFITLRVSQTKDVRKIPPFALLPMILQRVFVTQYLLFSKLETEDFF